MVFIDGPWSWILESDPQLLLGWRWVVLLKERGCRCSASQYVYFHRGLKYWADKIDAFRPNDDILSIPRILESVLASRAAVICRFRCIMAEIVYPLR